MNPSLNCHHIICKNKNKNKKTSQQDISTVAFTFFQMQRYNMLFPEPKRAQLKSSSSNSFTHLSNEHCIIPPTEWSVDKSSWNSLSHYLAWEMHLLALWQTCQTHTSQSYSLISTPLSQPGFSCLSHLSKRHCHFSSCSGWNLEDSLDSSLLLTPST